LALSLGLLYPVIVFLVQPALLRRRTGSSAWLASLGATRWEQTANLLFLLGCGLDLGNPALVLTGVVHPVVLPGQHIIVILTASVVFTAGLMPPTSVAFCPRWASYPTTPPPPDPGRSLRRERARRRVYACRSIETGVVS